MEWKATVRTLESQWRPLVAATTSVLAVVALAWQLAKFTWLVAEVAGFGARPQSAQTTSYQPVDRGQMDNNAGIDLSNLLSSHLFGKPGRRQEQKPEGSDAPEAKLDVDVKGIYASSRDGESLALIETPDTEKLLYHEGDSLADGVVVKSIERDQVVMERNGRVETLPLERGSIDMNDQVSASEPGGGERTRLGDYRDDMSKNPQQIRKLLQPAPVRNAAGGLVGFRINPGTSGDLFDITELEPGDVVTAVGSTQLDGDEAAMQALSELKYAEEIRVTVRRDGSEQSINLKFSD